MCPQVYVLRGAHKPESATSIRSCQGVFTDLSLLLELRFRARILNIFKFHKPVSKTNRPNYDIFCLLITLSFPCLISYTSNALIDMLKILFLREKDP